MGGFDALLVSIDKLFVELFARTEPRIFDWHVEIGAKTTHTNHFSSQFVDLDTIPHVEHENGADVTEARCLDDQGGRFFRMHKVPSHIAMGDSDCSAKLDLALKCGDDAAPATQYIAKSHNGDP